MQNLLTFLTITPLLSQLFIFFLSYDNQFKKSGTQKVSLGVLSIINGLNAFALGYLLGYLADEMLYTASSLSFLPILLTLLVALGNVVYLAIAKK